MKEQILKATLGVIFFALAATTGLAEYTSVYAIDKQNNDDGSFSVKYEVTHWADVEGGVEIDTYHVVVTFFKDGTEEFGFINPNPEGDDYTTKGDKDSLEDLALQNAKIKGIIEGKRRELDPKSPLGKYLTSKGQGLDPVWNPSDVAGKENEFDSAVGNGGFGYDPNGGTLSEQLQKKKNKKGNKDDEGGSNGDDPNAPFKPFGDLPGPPELVNPAWKDVSPAQSERSQSASSRMATTNTVSAPPVRKLKKGMIPARKYSSYNGAVLSAPGMSAGQSHASAHSSIVSSTTTAGLGTSSLANNPSTSTTRTLTTPGVQSFPASLPTPALNIRGATTIR